MAEMGDAFPRRDLGGYAENWGRSVEDRIKSLEKTDAALRGSLQNMSRQVDGALSNISSQFATWGRVIEQQSRIISAIPITLTETGFNSGFSIPNGTSTRFTITVPWPDDKANCSVVAMGQSFFLAPVAQSDVGAWRFRISGQGGFYGFNTPHNMDAKSSVFLGSRTYTRDPEVPPEDVTVEAQIVAGANHGTYPENQVNVVAILVFS